MINDEVNPSKPERDKMSESDKLTDFLVYTAFYRWHHVSKNLFFFTYFSCFDLALTYSTKFFAEKFLFIIYK